MTRRSTKFFDGSSCFKMFFFSTSNISISFYKQISMFACSQRFTHYLASNNCTFNLANFMDRSALYGRLCCSLNTGNAIILCGSTKYDIKNDNFNILLQNSDHKIKLTCWNEMDVKIICFCARVRHVRAYPALFEISQYEGVFLSADGIWLLQN